MIHGEVPRSPPRARDAGNTPGHGNLTVAQLLSQWERNALPARELSPRTIEVYQWCVEVLTESIGSTRADRLTPDRVEKAFALLAERRQRDEALQAVRSPSTRRTTS